MNNREIFDKVKTHLLTQNTRSVLPSGACAYRGTNGTMCAVGCLLKDEHYSEELESRPVRSQSVLVALNNSGIVLDDLGLSMLYELQRVHDGYGMDMWPTHLDRIERNYL